VPYSFVMDENMRPSTDRPTDAQIDALRTELTVKRLEATHDSIRRMLNWLRSERKKGGAELVGFDIEIHPVFDWFASRHLLDKDSLIEAVLTRPAVRDALPHFNITDPLTYNSKTGRPPRGWTVINPLQTPGDWATYLDSGGVHTQVREMGRTERETRGAAAMETSMSVYRSLTGNRYAPTIAVYRTSDPWCTWFPGMFNATWILFDLQQRILWLLAITDID
jgi:hypothetical protein